VNPDQLNIETDGEPPTIREFYEREFRHVLADLEQAHTAFGTGSVQYVAAAERVDRVRTRLREVA
jgi:hypothetical protein